MGARLAALLKKEDKTNPIVRVKPGVFGLRDWSEKKSKRGAKDDEAPASLDDGHGGERAGGRSRRPPGRSPRTKTRTTSPSWPCRVRTPSAPTWPRAAPSSSRTRTTTTSPSLAAPSSAQGAQRRRGGDGGSRRRRGQQARRRGLRRKPATEAAVEAARSRTGRAGVEAPRRVASDRSSAPGGSTRTGRGRAPFRRRVSPRRHRARRRGRGRARLATRSRRAASASARSTADHGGRDAERHRRPARRGRRPRRARARGRRVRRPRRLRSQRGTGRGPYRSSSAHAPRPPHRRPRLRDDAGHGVAPRGQPPPLGASQRPRFRFARTARVALTDWALGPDLARLELDVIQAIERYREASRRTMLRRLQELPATPSPSWRSSGSSGSAW
jgi:hypothetical protein